MIKTINNKKVILLIMAIAFNLLLAEDKDQTQNHSLIVSSFPSNSEIYYDLNKHYRNQADYHTPAKIPLNGDFTDSIHILKITKVGYQDTIFAIKVTPKKNNYAFIKLKPLVYESDQTNQEQFSSKQKQHRISKKLYLYSLMSYLAASGLYLASNWNFKEAEKISKEANQGLFRDNSNWEQLKKDYHHHYEKGEKWKKAGHATIGLGLSLTIAATILYF